MAGTQQAFSPLKKLEALIQGILARIQPADGFAYPVYGKIAKVNTPWGRVDGKSKGFSVDVNILKPDQSRNADIDTIKDVPMDPQTFGTAVMLLSQPVSGMIARIGFMYGNCSYPFVMGITAEGQTWPAGGAPYFGESMADLILRHTHLTTGLGAPTTNIQATVPPGGPVLPTQLQRTV